MARRILCVDPDDDARADTVEALRAEFDGLSPTFEFATATTVTDAEAALTVDTAAVITEYTLPDGTGFDVIDAARETCPDAGCVLYTGTDPDTIDTTELRGAITEYVGKGSAFGADRLTQLVRTTVETRSQSTYPVPQTEPERLAALRSYDLKNDAVVSSLERITDLAADHFGVDQASVNIIGEHSQEFLACHGGAEEWETMDREDSICTFTILEDEGVMAVPDVTEDPRFESRSEALLGMGIQAYLGANLTTSAGLTIGSLCVYDDEAREFSHADETYLRDLATVAMELIELRAAAPDSAVAATDRGNR
jgi:CheY-like chemotaxis protein